jgi:hypothetical protein
MFPSNIQEKLVEVINTQPECCQFGFALEAAHEVRLVEHDHDNVTLVIIYDKDDLYSMACREVLCAPRHLQGLREALSNHIGYNPTIHLRVTESAADNTLIASHYLN